MTKLLKRNAWLRAGVAMMLVASSVTLADAKELSKRPKTIVIDNLDTSTFSKGNPATRQSPRRSVVSATPSITQQVSQH